MRSTAPTVCYIPRESWIVLVAKVTQRFPKIYSPSMFVLHQRRESCGTLGEESTAYLRH